ncbi:putative integral membrane protein [Actinokineospora spheciospongiae]|uniref:Putative integral membrane protein n=1 Tax=Actinokineospora spheciospongiae TaxID=909613 RepID=W7IK77_9PSEU|nr:putative integral membrane protein [Actinokineospora spheciospongiae]
MQAYSEPFPAQAYPQAPPQMAAPMMGYHQMVPPQNGIGTAGFVTGLLGLLFSWLGIVGLILCIIGVSLSGVGISKANKGQATNKGLAVAGLVCGVIGLAIDVIVIIAVASVFASV